MLGLGLSDLGLRLQDFKLTVLGYWALGCT